MIKGGKDGKREGRNQAKKEGACALYQKKVIWCVHFVIIGSLRPAIWRGTYFCKALPLRQACVDRNNGEAVGSAIEAFYAELKVKSIRIQKKVDNKLPKFHVAAIPWCPAVQKYRR